MAERRIKNDAGLFAEPGSAAAPQLNTTQRIGDMTTTDIQRNAVLVFDGGQLTVKLNGQTGWASLVMKSDQLLSEDGYETLEIPPSELRAIRDFLNKQFPV